MNNSPAGRADGWSFPLWLLAAGLFMLVGGYRIENHGILARSDPGPRVFPLAIAAALLAGAAWEFVAAARRRARDAIPAADHPRWQFERRYVDLCVLLLGLVIYIALLPYLGFNLATFLFSAVLMARLGTRWWTALAAALLLIVVIQLLFGNAFGVPLPVSEWGVPI